MSSTIRTLCVALSIALILAAMAGLNIVSAQTPVDYDTDDDGLIEIEWLEQLNAVRWDLDGDGVVDDGANAEAYSAAFPDMARGMGCAEGCRGYELTRDLNFKSAGSYASGAMNDRWTSGNGWLPVGFSEDRPFSTTLQGNKHTIANLFINRIGANQPEHFGLLGVSYGEISEIGLVGNEVTGGANVGVLVGLNWGRVVSCFAAGTVSGSSVGGLVGDNRGSINSSHFDGNVSGEGIVGGLVGVSRGSITSSYANSNVSNGNMGGGLVGYNEGSIISSYADGTVDGRFRSGGLTGENRGEIANSYAAGTVSGGGPTGGLVGLNEGFLSSCYASSNVNGYSAGGLVGINYAVIATCYAIGSVSGEYDAGGFVGGNTGSIYSSYSTGYVSGRETGGFAGTNGGIIQFSYTISSVPVVEEGEDVIAGAFIWIKSR